MGWLARSAPASVRHDRTRRGRRARFMRECIGKDYQNVMSAKRFADTAVTSEHVPFIFSATSYGISELWRTRGSNAKQSNV
jgi:hypothetical protein